MKKISILLVLILSGMLVSAQKKNGVVYSEHETINKTKAMWDAFIKADGEKYSSFFADTVYEFTNDVMTTTLKKDLAKEVNWTTEFDNLKIADNAPAYPDAIEYTGGVFWVQDWLKLTGTHKKTGINVDLPVHNLYAFNKAGKIYSIHSYFDNSVFEEIGNSLTTKENGKVYINHPYIVSVRKLVNAFVAQDIDTYMSFFAKDAFFTDLTMEWGESKNYETQKHDIESLFKNIKDVKMMQRGYPDCIYYTKGDSYAVYSWWEYSYTDKNSGKKVKLPLLLTHTFNKDGKIRSESVYYSTNQFD